MFFTRTSYGFTKRKTQVGGTQGPCNHCALCCCNEGCISMVLVVSQWPVDMPCMWRQCARNVFFFPTNPCWVQSRNFLVKHISKECVATAKCIFPLQIFKTWLLAWVRISTQNLKIPCQTKPDMCKLQHLNGAFVTCKDQHFHHTVKYFSKRWTTHRDAWNKSDKNCCKISGGVAWNVWFTTNGMCAKNNNTAYTNVGRTSNNRVIAARDLYCCLLPQCKASRTCCSGFPIATKWCCDQDAKVVPCETFTQRACDRCGSLWKGGDVVATSRLNVRFPTNRTCAKNNTHIYVARTSNIRVIIVCELYCCLLPQWEALRTCRSGFSNYNRIMTAKHFSFWHCVLHVAI